MKLKSISVNGNNANDSGVGKKFLIISITLTVLLNGSVALWFLFFIHQNGIEKFIS